MYFDSSQMDRVCTKATLNLPSGMAWGWSEPRRPRAYTDCHQIDGLTFVCQNRQSIPSPAQRNSFSLATLTGRETGVKQMRSSYEQGQFGVTLCTCRAPARLESRAPTVALALNHGLNNSLHSNSGPVGATKFEYFAFTPL